MYYGPLSTQKHCCIAFNFNSSLCYLDVDLTEKFCRHDTIDACGQTLTQVKQAAHRSPSTMATTPPTNIFSLDKMVQAREAAALA